MASVKLHNVFIALGSNLGDRYENLRRALLHLEKILQINDRSSVYETPPWGVTDQPMFLNQVIRGSTELTPQELLKSLKGIEESMGRVKSRRFGPRKIDLDILLFDDLELTSPDLVIPHIRMIERAFVLIPLAEIAPRQLIPGTGHSVVEILEPYDKKDIRKVTEPGGN